MINIGILNRETYREIQHFASMITESAYALGTRCLYHKIVTDENGSVPRDCENDPIRKYEEPVEIDVIFTEQQLKIRDYNHTTESDKTAQSIYIPIHTCDGEFISIKSDSLLEVVDKNLYNSLRPYNSIEEIVSENHISGYKVVKPKDYQVYRTKEDSIIQLPDGSEIYLESKEGKYYIERYSIFYDITSVVSSAHQSHYWECQIAPHRGQFDIDSNEDGIQTTITGSVLAQDSGYINYNPKDVGELT